MSSLEDVKVGDTLLIPGHYSERTEQLVSVFRTTPTQVVTRGGVKYRKSDGRSIGTDDWSTVYAKKATLQDIERVKDRERKQQLRAMIRGALDNLTELASTERLQQVYDLLTAEDEK